MASLVAKPLKSIAKKTISPYVAPPDPYYEEVIDPVTNKVTKRPRPISSLPHGLSTSDLKLLQTLQKRAHRLDKGFHICGIRFGWTFFIGLIPVIGDLADLLLNEKLVVKKAKVGLDLPDELVRWMHINNLIGAGIGFVPIVGDIIMAMWRPNSRNIRLIEDYLRKRGDEYLKLRRDGVKFGQNGAILDDDDEEPSPEEEGNGWFRRKPQKKPFTQVHDVPQDAGSTSATVAVDTGVMTTSEQKKVVYIDKKHLHPGHGLTRGERIPEPQQHAQTTTL